MVFYQGYVTAFYFDQTFFRPEKDEFYDPDSPKEDALLFLEVRAPVIRKQIRVRGRVAEEVVEAAEVAEVEVRGGGGGREEGAAEEGAAEEGAAEEVVAARVAVQGRAVQRPAARALAAAGAIAVPAARGPAAAGAGEFPGLATPTTSSAPRGSARGTS